MIKEAAKFILSRLAPNYYAGIKACRSRAHSEKLERRWGCSELTRAFINKHGSIVIRGPFAGIEYVAETHHRHLTPKLIGAYEEELHPIWEEIFTKDYAQILDIGSAEGYYAVGLARHYPNAEVITFDTDNWARRMNRLMAECNGVNLKVYGACTQVWLQSNLQEGAFILSDCEGFEDQLLNPEKVPTLRYCDLLIELHESPAPGVTERMAKRFSDSHDLTFIEAERSDPTDYPELQNLPGQERNLAVSDLRSYNDQKWLYARLK